MHHPEDLLYSETHEWIKVNGDTVTIGITDHAQNELGDIVYLEAKEPGEAVEVEGEFGVIESVKAASDLIAPVSGEVVEVNNDAIDDPALLNVDPYKKGWIIKIKLSDTSQTDALINAGQYLEYIGE
ncbi:MAG: glycine cleavage system protein GcvH [bacterium]|nr:glycine cleavage system protein GcvH [bacterium]